MMKIFRITTVPQSLDSLLDGQLKFMREKGYELVGISSPGKCLDKVAQDQGVRTVAILMTRTISPLKDLDSLWQFYKLCKKEKPTIVHSHTPKAGVIAMLGSRLAGVPIRLHTVAGMPLMETKGVKRKLLNFIEKLTYRCATKIYPNSKGLLNFILEEKLIDPQKLKIIGYGSSNGVDTGRFDPDIFTIENRNKLCKELGIANHDYVFLFVGRVVTDKGINELVEAFSTLKESITKAHQSTDIQILNVNPHLIIVGNRESDLDPLKPKTEKLIGSHPYIHDVGYKTNVEEYFAIADVLVFPSYREGFPNVVMQAAAMQLNAIVSDINGCNEIITDGDNGWVVPPKNVEILTKKMLWCINHQEESRAMGQKSRKLIQQRYERRYVWEKILREYKNVIKGIEER